MPVAHNNNNNNNHEEEEQHEGSPERGPAAAGRSSDAQPSERGSWSEDAEASAASRRVVEQWLHVERTIFDERDQLPRGPLLDECLQWRGQIPHLRVVGHNAERGPEPWSGRDPVGELQFSEPIDGLAELRPDLERELLSREPSPARSASRQSHRQAREQVLDLVVEFICRELAEIEAEKLAEELSDGGGGGNGDGNLDDALRIAPAPTCPDKVPLTGNNFHYTVENVDSQQQPSQPPTEGEQPRAHSGRSRPGTVFNERIVVSPVPFVETTRESFTTLRRTPIQCNGDDCCELLNGAASRRDVGGARAKLPPQARRGGAPFVQASWNASVCPTVWPKSGKLAPIDRSRLPSSKRSFRSSKTAESPQPRRNRRSLSPIACGGRTSVHPASSRLCDCLDGQFDDLQIQGSQVARTPRCERAPKNKFARASRVEGQ